MYSPHHFNGGVNSRQYEEEEGYHDNYLNITGTFCNSLSAISRGIFQCTPLTTLMVDVNYTAL